jgi:hypothetical protein
METRKYERLIKPLSIGLTNWDDSPKGRGKPGGFAIGPGNAKREFRLNGRDHLEGLNLNFSWGVHTELGDWHAGMDPHVHPYPECLLFVGLDSASVKYLGAEIECCLGEEQETYAFNEPTAIVIPAGMPHGPITTKRIYSPRGFGFLAVELNSIPEITWLGKAVAELSAEEREAAPEGLNFADPDKILSNRPIQETGKYGHLVKPLKSSILIERGQLNPESGNQSGPKRGPGNADHLIWLNGKDLEGMNATIIWGFSSQPGIWHRGTGAHTHPVDEVLVYLGMDPDNMDCLGAEIELDMGKEHERHFIDKSTAVVCPAGTPHLPQVTRWVDRPFAFFAVSLSGDHKTESFD